MSATPSAPPLALPLPGASFGQAIRRLFAKYGTFTGRASRSEYWFAVLFSWLLSLVPTVLSILALMPLSAGTAGVRGPLLLIAGLVWLALVVVLIVPTIALAWRRLHDANLPGPLWFLGLIPSVGGIVVLILMLLPSNPQGARFDDHAASGPLA